MDALSSLVWCFFKRCFAMDGMLSTNRSLQHWCVTLWQRCASSAGVLDRWNTCSLSVHWPAYEPDSEGARCSSGLVIVDSSCEFRLVQEVLVPSVLIKHWSRGGAKQLIVFLELWPILVFLARYGRRFSNRRVIIFIDNNAVRDALIKGSSPLCDLFCMLALCSYYISSNSLCTWFTRVASDSNPGDDPSRGRAKEMAALIGALLASPLDAPEDLVKSTVAVESLIDFMQDAVHSKVGLQPIENGGGGGASVQWWYHIIEHVHIEWMSVKWYDASSGFTPLCQRQASNKSWMKQRVKAIIKDYYIKIYIYI